MFNLTITSPQEPKSPQPTDGDFFVRPGHEDELYFLYENMESKWQLIGLHDSIPWELPADTPEEAMNGERWLKVKNINIEVET